MIHVIDYGLGNIRAILTLYRRLGIDAIAVNDPGELIDATNIILPGVGAFDHALHLLNKSGMRPMLEQLVLGDKVPVLGICVGMQMFANSSDEGSMEGLGWIPGKVRKFIWNKGMNQLPLPHMGWNNVFTNNQDPLFFGLESMAKFYFLHSYYYECNSQHNAIASTPYGFNFSSAIASDNIYGVQFHPEKSHSFGVRLLKNFAEISYVAP